MYLGSERGTSRNSIDTQDTQYSASILTDELVQCICRNPKCAQGQRSGLYSTWNSTSIFNELHGHGDERWPTEVTSDTCFVVCPYRWSRSLGGKVSCCGHCRTSWGPAWCPGDGGARSATQNCAHWTRYLIWDLNHAKSETSLYHCKPTPPSNPKLAVHLDVFPTC